MSVSFMKTSAVTMRLVSDYGEVVGEGACQAGTSRWMHFDHLATSAVNANESTSILALISYVAFVSGKSEFCVERDFADRFNIPNPRCLPATKFDDAIRYLVEMAPAA